MDVRSKRVIVTGSEGLLGKSVSNSLSSEGWEVVPCDLTLGHDLQDENFVRAFFNKERAEALVNLFALNDHVSPSDPSNTFMDVSLSKIEEFLQVNVVALFSVCREFMRNSNEGRVVNATSIYASRSPRRELYNGREKHIGYGLSKAAVASLTKQLAVLSAPNFLVNAIVPGGVEFDQGTEFVNRYAQMVPMGRMARPTEFSDLIAYLISDKNTYMTGSLIVADGGFLA